MAPKSKRARNAAPETLRAVVRKGRIKLDEPTDLPDGTVLELEERDPYAHLDDVELSAGERAELKTSIDRGIEDTRHGRVRSLDDVIADLRQRR